MAKYNVSGMTCSACSAAVERAVKKVDGVVSCEVSLLTNSMTVTGTAEEDAVISAVKAAGYGASVFGSAGKPAEDKETYGLVYRLISSVVLLFVLMYVSMGHVMWGFPLPGVFNPMSVALSELLLTVAVMVINQRFFINGTKSFLRGTPNMDTLVALGSGAAFLYSVYVMFRMSANPTHMYLHELYFESAAMILALITVGKTLEARAKGKTTNAISALMNLAPKTATLYVDGKEVEVGVSDIKVGDVFIVRSGSAVPVDGEIIEGAGALDESAITGESVPVDKTVGDKVICATINKTGYLKCRATRVGEDTTISQIIKMVTDSASKKAPVSKIADKVSGIFVPVVIVIAIASAVVWLLVGRSFGYALARAISVLVISCPCALGLATPVAIMVGSGVGAKGGILFKTAEAQELCGKADIAVLDKTGTITTGHPTVTDVISADGVRDDMLLNVAAALEKKSEHPLGRAIVEFTRDMKTADADDFKTLVGSGVSGTVSGKACMGGSVSFMSSETELTDKILDASVALAKEGKTPLVFSEEGKVLGVIAVSDSIKDDSARAISELHNMGLRVVMLTGDNEDTARSIASACGVDDVYAGVMPDGKEKIVSDLKRDGFVIMVGDGVNDAPALTTADIGIAIGAGTDIAIDAADVVLAGSRLSDVAAAVRLSRATLKNIRENLFWAFIYNIVGIPLAAGVWIPLFGWELNPMFGAAAMSLSSFSVVSNALRLNLVDIHSTKKDRKIRKRRKNMLEKTIKVEGMMCPHCEARVKGALEALSEVSQASPNHTDGTVTLKLIGNVDDSTLKNIIEDNGYTFVE